jgi:uncharacterized membrane protein YbhN (UPF0104 family)
VPVDRLRRIVLRGLTFAVVGGGLWLALRGVSGSELLQALERTRVALVAALALPLLAVGLLPRTARYGALLPRRSPREGRFDLWSAVLLSMAGNNVLPLRAGELLRTRESVAAGYPLRQVAIAQLAEKVVEAITLVACAAPILAWRMGGRTALLLAGLGLAASSLAGWGLMHWTHRRFRLAQRQLAASLAWSLVADAVEIAVIAVCLRGVGLNDGLVTSITVFAGVNLAIALPSTPGNLGTLEAGAALPLVALGVDHDAALAFACVYRVVQWLPITVAGAIVWGIRMGSTPARRARVS